MPTTAKWALSLLVAIGLISIGWRYTPILMTLHVTVCFVLVIVIMLQSGNAADLAGAFGGAGSQTAFGPRGAATFLSRATTWCAIVFMMTSLTLSVKRAPTGSFSTGSILEQTQSTSPAKSPAPSPAKPASSAPVQAPTAPVQQSAPAPPASQSSQAPAKK
jgi:preprotein translocase subunit SecG